MPATRTLQVDVEDRRSATIAATSIEGLPRFRIQFEQEAVTIAAASPTNSVLGNTISRAVDSLLSLQRGDGHWVFELEADGTMPASHILLQHYLGTVENDVQRRLATYLRVSQGADGGWPLFHGGESDLSASVIAYFALKAAGDSADAPHMERARAVILERGGARRASVFVRITLALFGEVP